MKNNVLILTFLLVSMCGFNSCVPITSTTSSGYEKVLRFEDAAYESEIKTILLHPNMGDPQANLLPAVAKLGSSANLQLEFDDLRPARDSYYAKIFHCNQDWSRSMLQDLEFLNEFNEFSITTFEFSVDTHIPYVHYWFTLPNVKIPGNYVVVVFRGTNKDDIILSRRFMVYDNRVTLGLQSNLVGPGSVAALNQQMNFVVSYASQDLLNPMENVNVTIRQNQRWDNQASRIKPSFVREIEKKLEYRFFDDKKMFKGGNEFRFFDMRSLNSPGRNVQSVNKNVKPFQIYVGKDKTRQSDVYAQYRDMNGGFVIDNYDYRDASYANYADVHFTLASKQLPADVYVAGAFNYWQENEENRMAFDSARNEYTAHVLLKQGWYDYNYYVSSKSLPPWYLEGSHYETENKYEVFIYYRALRPMADLLIGYFAFEKNER